MLSYCNQQIGVKIAVIMYSFSSLRALLSVGPLSRRTARFGPCSTSPFVYNAFTVSKNRAICYLTGVTCAINNVEDL
jgi:hypothetical protein